MKGLFSLFVILCLLVIVGGCGGGGSSPKPFRFTATPSVSTPWMTEATFDLTISNAAKDLAGTVVTCTTSGLPSGANVNVVTLPFIVGEDGSSNNKLSVFLTDQVAPGTYPFTITAKVGKTSQTVKSTLIVTPVSPTVEILANGGASGTMAGLSTKVQVVALLHPGSTPTPGADNVVTFQDGGKLPPGISLTYPKPVTLTSYATPITIGIQTADDLGAQLYVFDILAMVNGERISVPVRLQVRPRTILDLTGADTFTTSVGGAGGTYEATLRLVSGPTLSTGLTVIPDVILPVGYRVAVESSNPVSPTSAGSPVVIRVIGPAGGATQSFGMNIHAEAGQASVDKHVQVTVTAMAAASLR